MTDPTDAADALFAQSYRQQEVQVGDMLPEPDERPADAEFRLLAANLPALCRMARSHDYITW